MCYFFIGKNSAKKITHTPAPYPSYKNTDSGEIYLKIVEKGPQQNGSHDDKRDKIEDHITYKEIKVRQKR